LGKKSFLKGAIILAAAGLLAKVIGAAFRIPLAYVVGAEGMGLYQMAFPIYTFLLVASTSGLPVAISKMVSERVAQNNRKAAHQVFAVALRMLFWMGLGSAVILAIMSYPLARLIGNPQAFYSILAISPALFFVAIMASFRGYFQGLQIMSPTAFSQLVEQFGRLAIGLVLAALLMGYGVEFGAAGAILGVTISSIFAVVFLVLTYYFHIVRFRGDHNLRAVNRFEPGNKLIAKSIIKIALPVTIGASVMPLVNLADKFMVVNILTSTYRGPNSGFFTVSEATGLYGLLTAFVNPLANMPSLFTIALAMSLVPAISESYVLRDKGAIGKKVTAGLRVMTMLALPASLGMFVLAEPIIAFLYRALSPAEIQNAAQILKISALGIFFLGLIQTLTAVLQGISRILVPVRNLFIGAIIKLALTFFLVRVPELNVMGAAIGTVVCYLIAAILNFWEVKKSIALTSRIRDIFLRPAIAASTMAVFVHFAFYFMNYVITNQHIVLFLAIFIGSVIYILSLFIVGAIHKEDLELMPGGKIIRRVLTKHISLK